MGVVVAAFMGLWALPVDAAYTRIDTGLQAIESAYALATAPSAAEAPADAWLVESVIPLGFTDDGQHIELVSFLVPLSGMADLAPVTTRAGPYVPQKTHTRVFCIVQSPLGLEVSQTEFCGLFPSGYYPYLQSDASLLSLDAWEHLSVGAANVFVLVANVGAMGQDFIHSDPDRQMAALLAPLVLPYTAAGGFQQFGSYASSQASLAWTATKTTVVPYAIAQAHHAKEAVVSCYYKAGVLFDNAFMRIDSTIGAAKYKLAEKFGGKAAKSGASLWPAASEGRQVVNGVEYTTHALERMSPQGLIQSGTEMVSRGVPPSVVENAIKYGSKIQGNTASEVVHVFENVRVVTNPEATRVITVITTGR
jgi:hypothetical protein